MKLEFKNFYAAEDIIKTCQELKCILVVFDGEGN